MYDKLLNHNTVFLADKDMKTMYLFLKTETTGLPPGWDTPVTYLDKLPRMVQIAWILTDDTDLILESKDFIIRPDNYEIPFEAAIIHGITTERALNEGVELTTVLNSLNDIIDEADQIVAHNMDFDSKILGAEYLRTGIETNFFDKRKLCTMRSSTDYCQIHGVLDLKFPTLSELHFNLFNKTYSVTHDALTDLKAIVKCFFEMRRKKII